MRNCLMGLGAVVLGMGIVILMGLDIAPAATAPAAPEATASRPATDVEIQTAAEKIMAQKWATKGEMYAALIALIKPGNTVTQLKIALPAGMGIERPATTAIGLELNSGINLYTSGSVITGWSIHYALDKEWSVSSSGTWSPDNGQKENDHLVIKNGPTLKRTEAPNAVPPATTSATTSAQPATDDKLTPAGRIKAQEWKTKGEMYAALIKLIKPGDTVEDLKRVLPIGMGNERPTTMKVTVSATNPNNQIIGTPMLYTGQTLVGTGGGWGLVYNLDKDYNVSCGGAWVDSHGSKEEDHLVIRWGPTLKRVEQPTTTTKP